MKVRSLISCTKRRCSLHERSIRRKAANGANPPASNAPVLRRCNTHEKGREGEESAVEYLIGKGYRILQRNFRMRRGEVDIIAEQDATVVFCEVKAWKSLPLESLEHAISAAKRRRIIQTAVWFLQTNRCYDQYHIRFDVIHIATGSDSVVRHLQSAFDGESLW
ncbi:MAG TPA: YraN family protein [Spirochaetia bacterium]|nr:YraN family protein [Spirochaetia bacterium]